MPLAIDLYAGLGGWAEGLLAEGWTSEGLACGCGRLPMPMGPPLRADGRLVDEPWEATLGNDRDRMA